MVRSICGLVSQLSFQDRAQVNRLMGPNFIADSDYLCVRATESENAQGETKTSFSSVSRHELTLNLSPGPWFIFLNSYYLSARPKIAAEGLSTQCGFLDQNRFDVKRICVSLVDEAKVSAVGEILIQAFTSQEPLTIMGRGLWRFFVDTFSPKYSYPA